MRKLLGRISLPIIAAASVAFTPAADAKKATPPSIRIEGISLDEYYADPGTKITYVPNRPVNACYDIGGPGQDPQQVVVVFFIHAVNIPKNAPTTLSITTPWDSQVRPEPTQSTPSFANVWFTNKGHGLATTSGGSDAPGHYYTYDDEGTRGNAFNGDYSVTTTVKVGGHTLHAHGTLTVDCQG